MIDFINNLLSKILSSGLGWIGSLIAFAIFMGGLYCAGQTGTVMRRGIELKKALTEARIQSRRSGQSIDIEKYGESRKQALWMMILPPLFWVFVYGLVFTMCPLRVALWSLLLLIAPILGFFGIFFVPDTDL